MKKSTTRRIAHFQRYINKTYDFSGLAATVQDFRQGAEIPTATVFLSVFWMFQLRLGSFNVSFRESGLAFPNLFDTVGEFRWHIPNG